MADVALGVLKIVGPVLLYFLISAIIRFSVYLYGHRTENEDGTFYRFVIQSVENDSLDIPMEVTITLKDSGVAFKEEPRVYAGPIDYSIRRSADGKRYNLRFDELAAYDTWVIVCKAPLEARNVTMEVGPVHDSKWRKPFAIVRREELALPSDRQWNVAGATKTPSISLGVLGMSVMVSLYFLVTSSVLHGPALLSEPAPVYYDVAIIATALVFAFLFWSIAQTPVPPAVQGYLLPSHKIELAPQSSHKS